MHVRTYDFGVQTDLIKFLFTAFLVRNQPEINVLISQSSFKKYIILLITFVIHQPELAVCMLLYGQL